MIDLRRFANARRSQRRSRWSVVFASGLLLATWTATAHAQINPFRGYKGPTLSKEDFTAGGEAAHKLLTEDQAEVGKSEDWTGPSSGNSGSISVEKTFRRQGMECRSLRSEVRYKTSSAPPRTFHLNVCRLHTGEWKVV